MKIIREPFFTIILAAIFLLLAQCIFLYGHTGRDDAFLTYWPAWTLANEGAILNFNGDRIEQSSTLLHTINLASLQGLLPSVAMPTLAWFVSMVGGVMTLLLVAMILRSQRVHAAGILVLASAPSLVFWSSSGMETTASTALFTAILLLCLQENFPRRNRWLVVVTGLAILNRPETFAVLLCFGVGGWLLSVIFGDRNQDRSLWRTLLLSTLVTVVAVSLWRYMYFGAWFPQPVSAKHSEPGLVNTIKGFFYIVWGGGSRITCYISGAGLLAWFLALFYRKHPRRWTVLVCGTLALSQMAFILATGGDWMEVTRFLLPVLPALLLCGILFLAKWPRALLAAIAALFLLALYDSWQFSRLESSGLAYHERQSALGRYLPDSVMIAHYSPTELQTKDALRDIPQLENLKSVIAQMENDPQGKSPEKINIASIQMGFIPYHLSKAFPSRLHFLDLRGLSTPELTQCSLFQYFSRTEYGVKVGLDDFLGMLTVLNRQCGIAKPDIIYDLGYEVRKQVLADNGYILTYREKRHITGDFSTRQIGSELFVAVRRELAAQYRIRDVEGNVPVMQQESSQTPRPNIVFVIADDISYDNFGFMGSVAAKTPTIDQLAQQGTVFTTAYVPTAFCRPSMGTLLTGQWPQQHRLHTNRGVIALPPGYVTLATRLQQHGYVTFTGGKFWEDEPELRGFDAYDSDWKQFARVNQDKLWQFVDQHAGKQPMFISWAPMLPHTPHNPPQQFLDAIDENAIYVQPGMPADKRDTFRQREKVLLAMNLWFDSEFRKFHDKLAEKKQLDNTLFIFMADNGFSHRAYSKSTPYELGLRTPVIFSWPGHVPVQRIDAQTDTIHLFNTVLDFAGVTAPASAPYSRSLRPVIEQKAPAIPEKLFGADYQSIAMKTDPTPRPERDIYALHLRDGEWKYIFYLRDLREENNFDLTFQSGMMPFLTRNAGDEDLFHLPTDTYEEKNLSSDPAQQNRLADYRHQVLAWWYRHEGKPFDAISQCPAQPAALCRKIEAVK